jgi:hypothetical protein
LLALRFVVKILRQWVNRARFGNGSDIGCKSADVTTFYGWIENLADLNRTAAVVLDALRAKDHEVGRDHRLVFAHFYDKASLVPGHDNLQFF